MPKKILSFTSSPWLCRAFCLKKESCVKISLYLSPESLIPPISHFSHNIFCFEKKTVLGQQQFTPLGIYHSNDDNVYMEDGKIISWILFSFPKRLSDFFQLMVSHIKSNSLKASIGKMLKAWIWKFRSWLQNSTWLNFLCSYSN